MHPELVLQKLTQRISEEFDETPGLRVSVGEASRFWGLDEMTCRQVLLRLHASGFLTIDADSRYRQITTEDLPLLRVARTA
jgi:hypothetical protein